MLNKGLVKLILSWREHRKGKGKNKKQDNEIVLMLTLRGLLCRKRKIKMGTLSFQIKYKKGFC